MRKKKAASKLLSQWPRLPSQEKLSRVVIGCDLDRLPQRRFAFRRKGNCFFLLRAEQGKPDRGCEITFRATTESDWRWKILAVGITGYGKDLLKGILGADCPIVETIAHASAGLHSFRMQIASATWAAWT